MAKKAAPKAAKSKPAPAGLHGNPPAVQQDVSHPKTAAKTVTKAEIHAHLSEKSGLTKKQVASVFEALSGAVGSAFGKKGPGLFVIPGLVKLKVVRKPATKAKQGINPFTKQPLTIKAKPARNVVKAVPLKALKDLV